MSKGGQPCDNLYITGLPSELDDDTLRQIFEAYAEVAQCKVLPPKQPGGKRAAFVRYGDPDTAQGVLESLNSGSIPLGLNAPLVAQFAEPMKGAAPALGGYGKSPAAQDAGAGRYSPYGAAGAKAAWKSPGDDAPPGDNLYITRLPAELDHAGFQQLFGQFGTITSSKVLPSKLPDGKCAAFCRYSSVEEASYVVREHAAGNILQEFAEPIVIKFADENRANAGGGKGAPPAGANGQPWGPGGATGQGDNLYITFLPPGTDQDSLNQIFGQYGTITNSRVLPSKVPGGKCAAFVRYSSPEEAAGVVSGFLAGTCLQEFAEPISVKFADENRNKGADKGKGKGQDGWEAWAGWVSPWSDWGASAGGWGASAGGWGGGWPTAGQAALPAPGGDKGKGKGGGAALSTNLYVTSLPAGLTNEQLSEVFGQYGSVVQCKVLPSKAVSGKCAGFVRYATQEEATSVVDSLNGNIPLGLDEPVKVQYADANKAQGQSGWDGAGGGKGGWGTSGEWVSPAGQQDWNGGGQGKGGAAEAPEGAVSAELLVQAFEMSGRMPGGQKFQNNEGTLYVSGLPVDTNDLHLYRIFASFGGISPKGVRAVQKPDGGCKGIGFVNFNSAEAAQAAISAYNGAQLPDGTILKVQIKT